MLFTPPLCHKLSHLLGPPPLEREVLYGRPQMTNFCLENRICFKLPEKIENSWKFAWKIEFVWTRIHDPQDFKPDATVPVWFSTGLWYYVYPFVYALRLSLCPCISVCLSLRLSV